MLSYSLKIENLLFKISPNAKGIRALIEKEPYAEVLKVLIGRVSTDELNKFIKYYQGIEGKSITDLTEENYDIDLFILDLEKIIEK